MQIFVVIKALVERDTPLRWGYDGGGMTVDGWVGMTSTDVILMYDMCTQFK